jgi:hypothetical protein
MTVHKLRSDSIRIINQEVVVADPFLPRVETPVSELSLHGKTCFRRALVEAERRWCGITSEYPMLSNEDGIFKSVEY